MGPLERGYALIIATAFKLHHCITIRASHPIDFTSAADAVKGANGAERALDLLYSGNNAHRLHSVLTDWIAQCQPVLNDKGTY